MATITNSTFSQLVKESNSHLKDDVKIDFDFFLNHVYENKKIFFVFNFYERRKLFTARCLLEDEKKFISSYYNKLEVKPDKKEFVYSKGGSFKYHLFDDCISISSDYVDFVIPEEIKREGGSYIEIFRKWFEEKKFKELYIDTKNKDLVNRNIVSEFNKTFPLDIFCNQINPNYNFIRERVNTGTVKVEYRFSKSEFYEKINNLLTKRDKLLKNSDLRKQLALCDFLLYKDESSINSYLNQKFKYDLIDNYGLENLKIFWKRHKEIKNEIYYLLIEHYKWTYNFKEKSYDEIDLNELGFVCCRYCESKAFNQAHLLSQKS